MISETDLELDEQFLALRESILSDEAFDQLCRRLASESATRRRYVEFSALCANLRQFGAGELAPFPEDVHAPTLSDAQILPALHETFQTEEPQTEESQTELVPAPIPQLPDHPRGGGVRRYAAVIGGLAAAILIGVTCWLSFRGAPVAEVTAVAAGGGTGVQLWQIHHRCFAGQPLKVDSGAVELTFNNKTVVTILGPATFTLDGSQRITLLDGALSVDASLAPHGFVVKTPNSMATDLGTEFGVIYNPSTGRSDVHVFKGLVLMSLSSDGSRQEQLTQGMAAHASGGEIALNSEGTQPQLFTRDLHEQPTSLDVVDIVSGGDGTTRRTGGGIDAVTGKTDQMEPCDQQVGNGTYCRPNGIPMLDGCFVPAESGERTLIDSAGHRLNLGPGHQITFDRIYAGTSIPTVLDPIATVLNGIDYGRDGHRFLFLHPTAGLTFDLAAIRRVHPTFSLAHFCAIAGNTCRRPQARDGKFEFQILVDGDSRFRHTFVMNDAIPIDVPIGRTDHFLTLLATSKTLDIAFQDLILGDPTFEATNPRN